MFKTASNAQIGNTGTAPGKDRANIEKAGNQLLHPIYTLSPISPTSSSHHVLLAVSNVNTQLIYQILFWCGRQGCGLSHVNTQCWAETRLEDFSLQPAFLLYNVTFYICLCFLWYFPSMVWLKVVFSWILLLRQTPIKIFQNWKYIFSNNLNGQNRGNWDRAAFPHKQQKFI